MFLRSFVIRFLSVFILAIGVCSVGNAAPARLDDPFAVDNLTWLGPPAARVNQLIYDSTIGATGSGSAGIVFTTNNPNASLGDDLTFAPIPANTQITGVNFAFAIPANIAVPNADAIITFWNDYDTNAGTNALALSNPVAPSIRVNVGSFATNAAVRAFSSGIVDTTALNLFFPDTSGGVSISFVAATTNTILTGQTITPALSSGTVAPGSNILTEFLLDGFAPAPLDGQFTGAEFVGFGGANAANNKLWLQVRGDVVPEPASMMAIPILGLLALRRRSR